MPVQGLVRLRRHLFGRQAAFGTKVAATRAYPFRGVPTNELNWTDPEVDMGSLDPIAAPSRGAPALSADLTDNQVAYNSIPLMMAAFFGGQVEPTGAGTALTWEHAPASATVDEPDLFTYEFGDDVVTDWFQMGDGLLESVEFTVPEGLGPVTASMSWRFGSTSSTGSTDSPVTGPVPTPGLVIETNPALVYGKDLGIYIAATADELEYGASQIVDALHTATLRFGGDIGEKRYANGDQTFDVDAYVRETRSIELECTFAKTADTVGLLSESDYWMSDQSVDRYVRLLFTSTAMADTTPDVPYQWDIAFPMRYYTRVEGEVGGNSVVVLTGHAWYDPTDFVGVFRSRAVTTLDSAGLGDVGS
jgi:hypothetical protein